jgi:hypothetical protein
MSDDRYERARRAAAASARRIAFGHPAQWPLPRGEGAQDARDRDLADSFDDITDDETSF